MDTLVYSELYPTDIIDTFIEIRLYYAKQYDSRRGYYIVVKPVVIEDKGSYITKTFIAYSGFKRFIKEVGKYSSKSANEAIVHWKENEIEYLKYFEKDYNTLKLKEQ